MPISRFSAFIIATAIFQHAAFAADPSQLLGKWIEKFQNAARMVTEFTATTISSYPVNKFGEPTKQPQPSEVSYRDLGNTIGIDFKAGGGIMAMIKDQNNMVLIFPGMGSRPLTRVEP